MKLATDMLGLLFALSKRATEARMFVLLVRKIHTNVAICLPSFCQKGSYHQLMVSGSSSWASRAYRIYRCWSGASSFQLPSPKLLLLKHERLEPMSFSKASRRLGHVRLRVFASLLPVPNIHCFALFNPKFDPPS